METGSGSRGVDRGLLVALDEVLALVASAIPWAERDSNRVIWHDAAPAVPDGVPAWAAGVRALFDACVAIKMADVGNGWFIHPLGSDPPDDPFVPREVAGRGRCFPLGTDGGGSWFVVVDDGAVLRLPPGLLRNGVYNPRHDDQIVQMAPSVRAFVELMHAKAAEALAAGQV